MGSAIILLPVALAHWLAGFAVLDGLLFRRATSAAPAVGKGTASATRLSLIIPARNEEQSLPRLLGSLATQSIKPVEIIVVDDQSTDGTAAVAQQFGATVLSSQPLPDGWRGKTWACWQAAQVASGDLFLFVDADTWFEPDGLHKLLALHAGGALSVGPYHVMEKPYEQLSAFFNLLMAAGMGAFTLWSGEPRGLFGQVLLVGREDYQKVRGHEAVKGRILENFYLAEQFREKGVRLRCTVGKGVCAFRMYPNGLRELIDGWTKGFASGAARTPLVLLLLLLVWMGGMVVTLFLLTYGWPGILMYLLYAAQLHLLLRQVGAFRWYTALFFPVTLVFYFLVFTWSVLRSGKTVSWKGREIHAH